jgi:ABC-2 type transport system ATP-binding protein
VESPVHQLSKGMQQKLQFIIATIHNPELVILDEPFRGLDPLNQKLVREKIRQFRKEGKAVLLSTHQLNEAEDLCDYFLLIHHGETVLQGTLAQLRKKFQLEKQFQLNY